jgi:hypothetical protein
MIVLQFNDVYFCWGLLMVRSLALYEPGLRIFVDGINLAPEQMEQLQQAHPKLMVENREIDRSLASRQYMAGRKSLVILEAFDRFPEEKWFGLFDADLLIRRPLPDLWAKLARRPAGLIRTDGVWNGRVYEHLLVPSGIVLVRRDGQALVESWARWHTHSEPLFNRQPGGWFWDQCTLLQALRETGMPHERIPMGRFANGALSPAAAVWSAHDGDKEELYQRFVAEDQRQRAVVR